MRCLIVVVSQLQLAFRKIQVKKMGFKLRCMYWLLFYADDINSLGVNISTEKNTWAHLVSIKGFWLKNSQKNICILNTEYGTKLQYGDK
jgi:hypothetical protein